MSIRFTRARFVIVFSLLFIVAVLAAVRFVPSTRADNESAVLPPVTATDTVAVVIGNGDGNADPGETLEYTVTVTNGGTDATGVSLSSTLQNITTFVGGSVAIGPAAGNDTYPQTVIGNVSINSASIPYNVLGNDFLGQNPAATITAFDATSANGGNVVVNTGTGEFTYNPPPGFEGNDTFNYTLSNATSTSIGTVTIPVSGMVWFINNNAAACTTLAAGCGRLSNPLSTLAAFQALNNGAGNNPAANDNIFVFESATTYSGGVTLLANQRITGQDSTATLASITGLTPPSGSTAFPAMNTGGNATMLISGGVNVSGGGNTVRGMTINNTSTAKITGTNFGTLTVGNNVSPDVIVSGTGKAIDLNNGTFAPSSAFTSVATTSSTSHGMQLISVGGTVAFGSTSVSGSASQGIFVNASNVNLNFGNTTVGANTAGEGVRLESNTGGTRTFGTLSITNSAVQGFTDSGGGNTNVTGLATITNPANVGILISSKSAGTSVTFANVSNTGSGSHGVHLNNNVGTVTFGDLDITADANQRGILATTNTGAITTTSGTISTTNATAVEIVGTSAASRTPLNMQLTSVSALASGGNPPNGIALSNTSATGAPGGFRVLGTGGTCTKATPTCSGGRIQSTSGADVPGATPGANTAYPGIGVRLHDAATVVLTRMQLDGTHQNFGIRGVNVVGFTLDTSVIDGTFGNSLTTDNDGTGSLGEDSVRFTNLTGSAAITNSYLGGGFSFVLRVVNNTGTLNRLTVSGSTIGGAGVGEGANANDAVQFIATGIASPATANLSLLNNTLSQAKGDIVQFGSNQNGTADLIMRGNTISNNHPSIVSGVGGLTIATTSAVGQTATLTYDISCNKMQDARGNAMTLFKGGPGTTNMTGTVFNNRIGVTGVVGSASDEAAGIQVDAQGSGTHTVLIKNNQIRRHNFAGISMQSGDGSATLNATVVGNFVAEPGAFGFAGFYAESGALPATDTIRLNLKLGGAGAEQNNFVDGDPFNFSDVLYSKIGALTQFNLSRVTSVSNDPVVITQNNNVAAITVSSVAGITPVNTVPALPAAIDETCAPPAIAPPAEEGTANIIYGSENNLSLLNTPAESGEWRVEGGEPIFAAMPFYLRKSSAFPWDELKASGYAATPAAQPRDEMVAASGEASFTANRAAKPKSEPSFTVGLLMRLGDMISPTVYAQDIKFVKSGGNSPESGETVTTTPTFTLPANKSVVVKYRATVDNGPYAAGINNIDNFATISGSNFANVNSTTASIALDAAPDLSVTTNDGGATETQPGVVNTYALGYANATGINLQGASGVTISNIVPPNTTFNAASSSAGWSCADNSPAGTPCTNTIGGLAAGGSGSINFAVNVLGNLPATALTIADTATIAESPANANGTDLNTVDNTSTDTDNVRGIWIGGTSADWATNTNWSNNLLPNTPQNISVPSGGGANAPSITSADVTVDRLFDSGKNITVGAGRILLANLSFDLGANNVLGAGTLELASGAPITRTTGQVNCALKKNFINGNFTDEQEAPTAIFTYPVGTATGFSPVTANVTAGSTGSLTVQAIDGTAPSTPSLSDATTLDRYWQMTETGSLTASLTFSYLTADIDGVETNYRMIRSSAGTPPIRFPNGAPCPGVGSPCVDSAANTIFAANVQTFDNFWTAGEPLAPTAAGVSISGQVRTADGRGIRNARIVVTGNTIVEPRTALTSTFGYYTIEGLQAGETYVVTVNSKRFTFQVPSHVITALDNMNDLDFIAFPD